MSNVERQVPGWERKGERDCPIIKCPMLSETVLRRDEGRAWVYIVREIKA